MSDQSPAANFAFVGNYSHHLPLARGMSDGIMVYRFDSETGELTHAHTTSDVVNPSFLAVHPSGRFLYAVNEIVEYAGMSGGSVSAFTVDRSTGALALLNEQPTLGADPCHVTIPRTGHHVLVANYTGGSVAMYRIAADGSLGGSSDFKQHAGSSADPNRPTEPHAHSTTIDPTTRFAMVADLGLDRVFVYRLDLALGRLVSNDPPYYQGKLGAGPRHFDFHPSGRYAYVINELDLTLSALAYDSVGGILTHVQTESTLPPGFEPFGSTADVHVHPTGRFVYGSNRGHDSIVVFAIDASTGRITYVENQSTGGKTPRNFAIDPTGRFLLAANQDSNTIETFRIDAETGKLKPTGVSIESPSPVCIKFARL